METIIILSGLAAIIAATVTITVEVLFEIEQVTNELFNPYHFTVEDWNDL